MTIEIIALILAIITGILAILVECNTLSNHTKEICHLIHNQKKLEKQVEELTTKVDDLKHDLFIKDVNKSLNLCNNKHYNNTII